MPEPAGGPLGLLVMAYGSPDRTEDILPYYTDIRRGRPPTPELLAELTGRYAAIGGSRLNVITHQQAAALERAAAEALGLPCRAYVGMKHWRPYIAAAVARMIADGVRQAVALVLTPQYSRMSVEVYLAAAREASGGTPLRWVEVPAWYDEPLFLDFLARRVCAGLERFPAEERSKVAVIFTAHSLPERILTWNDPYPGQLQETASSVAQRAGVREWRFAYQSAGRTPEPWLGPDLLSVLEEVHHAGAPAVLVCPVGFVADHLEVLYDVDIEAGERARALGMALERTGSPNADPAFIAALAAAVQKRWAASADR